MAKKLAVILLGILCLSILSITGCGKGEAEVAQNGDTVKVHYKGSLSDGTVFDSSEGRDPLEFTVGAGQMIQGFDKAVVGMKVGETKTVTIPADEAYGQHDDKYIMEIDRSELPQDINPTVGDKLQMQTSNGAMIVTIIKVSDTTFTIDANHELAGKDLTFEIKLAELNKKK
jgi:peptidylprolyl isomerase